MRSKVYTMKTGGRSPYPAVGLVQQMVTLFDAAGFPEMIKPGDTVAIKTHCGEWNNTAYLRPVYARTLVDRIKALGGRPFVCDTTTQTYAPDASRATALDALITAERNGFTSGTLGCPFIIADGYNGTDDMRLDLPDGHILKEVYIAKAIALADVLIALTHFKGHRTGVIGGSIKNLGIGAQSKRGKANVHMGGHPKYGLDVSTDFHPELCKGRSCPVWEECEGSCPYGLIHIHENSIVWNKSLCKNCLAHLISSTRCGVFNKPKEYSRATCAAIADGCLGAVTAVGRGKVGFINMAIDISPICDCAPFADMPIMPHLGVFASKDPVALDKATMDAARDAPGMPGSAVDDCDSTECGVCKFSALSPHGLHGGDSIQIVTGTLNGLGTMDYELVDVPPSEDDTNWRFPDNRTNREKFGPLYMSEDPFPGYKHGGKGFKREETYEREILSEDNI